SSGEAARCDDRAPGEPRVLTGALARSLTSSQRRAGTRPRPTVSSSPASEQTPVTSHVHCQSPVALATAATSGGPANWPSADHCWTQPTVVDNVPSLGASRTASANSVAGISPPTAENSSTAAYRHAGGKPALLLPAKVAAAAR